MQKISEEKVSAEYEKFSEKYNSEFYNDYRIINQFKILKSGIKGLYEDKKYSRASKYMNKFDEYVSIITEGFGMPSEAERVHLGIRSLDKLLREYLSDLERDIKEDIDNLEKNENLDQDKLASLKEIFKNRGAGNLQNKLDALNRCKDELHELELGEEFRGIEEKLDKAQYGNEYLEVKRQNDARSELAYWYQNEISYDTVLELGLDNANNREKMKADLKDATEYEISWTTNNVKSASSKYESQITYETTESISDDIYYYHVMQNDLDLSNRKIISENESKQDIVSQISNCQNMIDSLELYTEHEERREISEQVKSDIDILQKRLVDIKKQYQEVTARIDELNLDVKKRIDEFTSTININKNEERTKALTKVDEKQGIFKKLANFFKEKVTALVNSGKATKERFEEEREEKSKLISEKINQCEKRNGQTYSKLDFSNLKRRVAGVVGAGLMMVGNGTSLQNSVNIDELVSDNLLKIEDADFSRTYSVSDTSITDALDRFFEDDTAVNKKYQQVVNNMEFSPKVKEMFAYNIQCYIENYDRNAQAFGFDATMEETLDQIISSAKDVGHGIDVNYNLGPNIGAYTEGVGKDDSVKRITMNGKGSLGYNSLFHEIEHTDQGMDIQNSEGGYFEGLACPKKFYRFIQEGDAEFLQTLGSDSIIDTGMSFVYSDGWSMYNMLMQTVGVNELHEYVKTGCKNEQFVDFVSRRFDEQRLSKEQADNFIISLQNCLGGRMEYIYKDKEIVSEPNTDFGIKAFKSYKSSKNKSDSEKFKELEEVTLDILETKLKNADSKEELEKAIQDMSRFKMFSSCNDAQIKRNSLQWNDLHFEMANEVFSDNDIYTKIYDAYVDHIGELELTQEEFVDCFDTSYECAEILESIKGDNEYKIVSQEKEENRETEEITLDDANELTGSDDEIIVQEKFEEDNNLEVNDKQQKESKKDKKPEVKTEEQKESKEDKKPEVKTEEQKESNENKKQEVNNEEQIKDSKEDKKVEEETTPKEEVLEEIISVEEAMEQERIEFEKEVLEDKISLEKEMEQQRIKAESENEILEDVEELDEDGNLIVENGQDNEHSEEVLEDIEELDEDGNLAIESTENQKKKSLKKEKMPEKIVQDNSDKISKKATEDIKDLIDKYKKQEQQHKEKITARRRKEVAASELENGADEKYKLDNDFKSNLQEMTEVEQSNENKTRFTMNQINQMKKDLLDVLKKGKISMFDAMEAVEQIKQGKVPDVIKNKDDKELN